MRLSVHACAFVLALCFTGAFGAGGGDAVAPDKANLPKLEFLDKVRGRDASYVKITVPTIPGCVSMIWCYEDRFGKGTGETREDGSVVMHHEAGDLKAETVWTPLPNAVDVRLTVTGPEEQLRKRSHSNPCWQHWPSKSFGNQGNYPDDFAARCFIYTVRGLTLLADTVRFVRADRRPMRAETNNPPWIQNYTPLRRRHQGNSIKWRGIGTDRPILPIIGVVSRDGRWLQAWAWPRDNSRLGQVWHDCLHPTPGLRADFNPETGRIESHGKLYFMENDADALAEAYMADFGPQALGPSLTIEAEGPVLLIRSPDVPDSVLRLKLPTAFGGLPLPDITKPKWVKRPWGTFHADAYTGPADKRGSCHVWAHPCDDFVAVSVTVVNQTPRLLTATIEADLDISAAPALEKGEAAADLFWEGVTRKDVEENVTRAGGQIPGIIPGAYRTLRGRLYFLKGTAQDVAAQEKATRQEWQRALPYLVAPPPE